MSSDAAEHIPDEHRLLSGKRRSQRIPRQIDARLIGTKGEKYRARTIDLSRGGMLVELTDPAFLETAAEDHGQRFAAIANLMSTQFADGMKVHFGSVRIRSKAQVVRLVTRISDMAFLLGCRFVPDLTDSECWQLGLDVALDETQVDAVLSVPLHADMPVKNGKHPHPAKHPAGPRDVQKPEHPLSPGSGKGR
jgi:hypothetical protein